MHDRSSVKMVKIDDDDEANEYGLTERPALVFFEHQVPNIFEGDLTDHEQGVQLCLKNRKLGIFWQFLRIYLVFKQLWQFALLANVLTVHKWQNIPRIGSWTIHQFYF